MSTTIYPITIITGRSGSGKSTAMGAFEDAGYYCVDNMPVVLLPHFLEKAVPAALPPAGYAFVMDLREPAFLQNFPTVFADLKSHKYPLQIIFLEAREEILVQRYSQTRRRHPLHPQGPLIDSIRAEKELLADLRGRADRVIDTSRYTVHGLKAVVWEIAQAGGLKLALQINVTSFGFKYGSPVDADLVMDVRFLPNPYFIPELKPLSGEETAVREYVLAKQETRRFLERYFSLLDYLIPLYEKAAKHLAAGARKVVISAPATDPDITIVMGVNSNQYEPQNHHIISNASCTTNCLAPLAKVLLEHFGIRHGLMTTIHAYTGGQRLLDFPHKDLRRARAAALSMVPTTTGAARAVALVLPELDGKLNGLAIRVPTPNVSIVDLVATVEKKGITPSDINSAVKEASEGALKGILGYSEIPLVSMDYNGCGLSSVFDAPTTYVIDDMVKVLSWYDNETGYSNRMVDLAAMIGSHL